MKLCKNKFSCRKCCVRLKSRSDGKTKYRANREEHCATLNERNIFCAR